MSCMRNIEVSPFQCLRRLPIPGHSLSLISSDIKGIVNQEMRRSFASAHCIHAKGKASVVNGMNQNIRILNKKAGRSSESSKTFYSGNLKILADEFTQKSRIFQNYLCLQALDGEEIWLQNKTKASPVQTSMHFILKKVEEKRKGFQFPEAGKFRAEDQRFEEFSEDEYEKQEVMLNSAFNPHTVMVT